LPPGAGFFKFHGNRHLIPVLGTLICELRLAGGPRRGTTSLFHLFSNDFLSLDNYPGIVSRRFLFESSAVSLHPPPYDAHAEILAIGSLVGRLDGTAESGASL